MIVWLRHIGITLSIDPSNRVRWLDQGDKPFDIATRDRQIVASKPGMCLELTVHVLLNANVKTCPEAVSV
jgi:hypothetical protein